MSMFWIIIGASLIVIDFAVMLVYPIVFGVIALSLGVMLLLGLDLPVWAQFLSILSVGSMATLVLVKKGTIAGNKTSVQTLSDDLDRFSSITGKECIVITDFSDSNEGMVFCDGTDWRSIGDEQYKKGERLIVVSRDGFLLKVSRNINLNKTKG